MKIEVIRDNEDRLHRERWTFWADTHIGHSADLRVYLDTYDRESRATPRHKFQSDESYRRIDSRGHRLTTNDVPRPAGVEAEVRADIAKRIRVVYQDSRNVVAPFSGLVDPLTED